MDTPVITTTWWGWQYRKITFTEALDVDVKAVRQLIDESYESDNQRPRINNLRT